MSRQQAHQVFAPRLESVPRARHFVASVLPLGERAVDTVALLVSELATNAVVHAATEFEVEVAHDDQTVTVSVIDGSPTLPRPRDVAPNSEGGGRGLAIVDAFSTRWGCESIPGDGKRTWFQLVP